MFHDIGRARANNFSSNISQSRISKRQRAFSRAFRDIEPLEKRVLLSSYSFSALASFVSTGNRPESGVVADNSGNLFGATFMGEAFDDGTIFEIPHGTNTINVITLFNGTNGANPDALAMNHKNNTLYGATAAGDTNGSNAGTLFQIINGTFTALHLFSPATDGSAPNALALDASGNLYGTTNTGGANGDGTIFKFNPASNTFTTLHSFNGTDGANPSGGLILDSSGHLYGTTNVGGANGDGTVFRFVTGSQAFSTLHSFNGTDGAKPDSLTADTSGNLYGTAYTGGSGTDGTVFKISAGKFQTLYTFTGTAGNGANPDALTWASNKLYGTTFGGGTTGDGTVFSIATASNSFSFSTLASFNSSATGQNPQGRLLLSGGNLIGTASSGGALAEGAVFNLSIATHVLSDVVAFGAPASDAPFGDLVPDGSGHFFGTGGAGGIGDNAGVFQFDTATNTISAAGLFHGTDGASPNSLVWDSANSTLYGTAQYAGTSGTNSGTIFQIVGGQITALHSLSAITDGSDPDTLVLFHGSLYGTANIGGANGDGSIFQFNLASNTFINLFSFNGTNGAHPAGNLLVDASGNLYGTTFGGGAQGDGTIFKFNPTTKAINTLHSFNGTDGAKPEGDIAMDASGNLFGTTQAGSVNGTGNVYELSGGTVSTLFSFGGAFTYNANGITRDPSGKLFGTTFAGGANGVGMVYELSGGTFTNLYSFTGAKDGEHPLGGLYIDAGGNLWGTAQDGGAHAVGTVFKLTAPVPGPATQLVFIQQPTNTGIGSIISPPVEVAIEDANGNIVTNNSSLVTIGIASGPLFGFLGGTRVVPAVNGVAVFKNLWVGWPGIYRLQASDQKLTAATSDAFAVSFKVGFGASQAQTFDIAFQLLADQFQSVLGGIAAVLG